MTPLDLTLLPLVVALASAAVKATVLLALSAIAAACCQRRSAALRHLIWTTGLGAALAVLVLPMILPAWHVLRVPVVSWSPTAFATVAAEPRRHVALEPSRMTEGAIVPAPSSITSSDTHTAPAARSEAGARGTLHWPSMAAGIWLLGVIVVLGRYVWSSVALHRLSRRATALQGSDCGALAQQIARDMGIARPVRLLESDDVELPLAWGLLRPCVMLPGDAPEWSPARRRYVLQHELAHVGRFDACTQFVAHAASAIFWFHPLAWYAGRRMRHERERACDDHVLAHGAVASEYAHELLALVRAYGHIDRHPIALAMARRSQFEGRLLALLDPTVDRGVSSSHSIALVLGLAMALVVPVAAMRGAAPAVALSPAASSRATSSPATSSPAVSSPASAPVAFAPVARQVRRPVAAERAPDDIFAGCASRPSNHNSEHMDWDRDKISWTASARTGDCSVELKSEGHVEFNANVTALARISAGGYLDVTTTLHGDITRLVARGSNDGGLTYEFSRNGERADFGADGTAWFSRFLIGLDRQTAFAIDTRFPLLLRNGGPSNVLDEIDRIHSDHAKSMYLLRLVEHELLNADALRRVCEAAVLLNTSHDQARVLLSFLERASPDADQVRTILASIVNMDVDHDKCRVLIALAGTRPLDGALREAYLQAAGTIRVEYDRTRAIGALGRAR